MALVVFIHRGTFDDVRDDGRANIREKALQMLLDIP
jgi:hypothetical protein